MNDIDQNAPGLNGLEQLQRMIEMDVRAPICDTLNFSLVEVARGHVVFEGRPDSRAYNPIGTVHGGYAATLLDSACGCAAHSCLSETQLYTTLELKVAYHRPITSETGKLRAEGHVLSIGRRAAFAEATLMNANGKLHASATSTLLIFEQ